MGTPFSVSAVASYQRPGGPYSFRRSPALDVPALVRNVLGHLAQLDRRANQVAACVVVAPTCADPGEVRAAPNDAEIRLAVAVRAAGAGDALLDGSGSLVRFA